MWDLVSVEDQLDWIENQLASPAEQRALDRAILAACTTVCAILAAFAFLPSWAI